MNRKRTGRPPMAGGQESFATLRRSRPSAERDAAMRRTILQIPPGFVSSYAKVAAAAGYPGYHRQTAQLLRREGASLPWQRVVGAQGEIKTWYELRDTQRKLLEAEGVRFIGRRVNLESCEHHFRPWTWDS